MGLIRRIKRYCANVECKALLVKKSTETPGNFLKRTTCNTSCAGAYRKQKASTVDMCFCGKQAIGNGNPYCCWDHRLIAMKCKQWRIPLTMEHYTEYSDRLEAEQRQLDKYF